MKCLKRIKKWQQFWVKFATSEDRRLEELRRRGRERGRGEWTSFKHLGSSLVRRCFTVIDFTNNWQQTWRNRRDGTIEGGRGREKETEQTTQIDHWSVCEDSIFSLLLNVSQTGERGRGRYTNQTLTRRRKEQKFIHCHCKI